MRRIMSLAAGCLAASVATAALLVGPATVAGADGTLVVGDTATLVSKGAAVLVPMEVTCDVSPWLGSSATVWLRERSGNRIAEGVGTASLVCDGTAQSAQALVAANDVPFKPGTALVTVSTFLCDQYGCRSTSETTEIRIRH